MEHEMVLEFSESGGSIVVAASPSSITLFKGDFLKVSVKIQENEQLSAPHIRSAEYAAGGNTTMFSLGSDQEMAAGIEVTWFCVQNIGGLSQRQIYDVAMTGTVEDEAQVKRPWEVMVEFVLEATEDPLATNPKIASVEVAILPPVAFTIDVADTVSPTQIPNPTTLDSQVIHLSLQQDLVVAVEAGPGAQNAGFTAINYFDFYNVLMICRFSLGALQKVPTGIAMTAFALRNNGKQVGDPTFQITFEGTVETSFGWRLWTFDPELTLKTTVGQES